jgi:hypothetical protein
MSPLIRYRLLFSEPTRRMRWLIQTRAVRPPIGGAVRLRTKHFGRHQGGAIRDGVVVAVS